MAPDTPAPTGQPGPATPAGAIHDIGYRHYTGIRQDKARVFLTLFTYGLRGAYGLGRSAKSKVAPILLLMAVTVPAAIVVVVASVTRGFIDVGYDEYLANIQILVYIWIAILAPYVISRDLRHSITTLYFSRPLDRTRYVLARYASAVSAILLFMAIPLVVLFVGALLTEQSLKDEIPDFLRAFLLASLNALLLGAVGIAVAVLAPRRGMGIAAIIAVLLVLGAVSGVLGEVMRAGDHQTASLYSGLISPTILADGIGASMLGTNSSSGIEPESIVEKIVFVGAYIAWLGACAGVLALRFRKESVI